MTDQDWSVKFAKVDDRFIQSSIPESRSLEVIQKEATSRSDFVGYDMASKGPEFVVNANGITVPPPNYLVANVRKLKVFVGGLPQSATDEDFLRHFSAFGDAVLDIEIKMDKITGRSRGFGFVSIQNCDSTRLFNSVHRLCGKVVDVAEVTETKLTILGITFATTQQSLLDHFQKFGVVVSVELHQEQTPQGLIRPSASVIFETTEACNNALYEPCHLVDNVRLDVRKAEPRRKGRFANPAQGTPSLQGSPLNTPSVNATYGAFGGYGEFQLAPPPAPPHLAYGALGVPSSYGYQFPVPGYDMIPLVGSSNRFHPY